MTKIRKSQFHPSIHEHTYEQQKQSDNQQPYIVLTNTLTLSKTAVSCE